MKTGKKPACLICPWYKRWLCVFACEKYYMGLALCETYARKPEFSSGTFCCGCGAHFPVAEFTWKEDGAVVGS